METQPRELSELETMDWSRLGHAYGEASDLPDHLRELNGSSRQEREEAYAALISKVWHQGDVYEATAPTVPFLAGLMFTSSGPMAYFSGAILALVAQSAFLPLVDSAVSDNAARQTTREQLVALGERFSEFETETHQEDSRSKVARYISRLVTGDLQANAALFEEAYEGCEKKAGAMGGEAEEYPPSAEFARWLDENTELSRRGQVVALGWGREHAVEAPQLAARALQHIDADHLQHDRRLVEVLVELGRGRRDRARRMALELGREWLAPAETDGFNQSVSRDSVLSMLEHFSDDAVQQLHEQVRQADEPEYIIPDW